MCQQPGVDRDPGWRNGVRIWSPRLFETVRRSLRLGGTQPTSGESHPEKTTEEFAAYQAQRRQELWGMMMFDEFRALDYLANRPEVDANRLGALGMSMGSTKAWWLAALEPRVRVCMDVCCPVELFDCPH